LREIFAVCDELNERIILTADTVSRLTALKTYESVVVTDNNETVIHETEGENETVTQITDETEPKDTDIVDKHDDVIPMNEKH
jgi:peroxiredoxin family protein